MVKKKREILVRVELKNVSQKVNDIAPILCASGFVQREGESEEAMEERIRKHASMRIDEFFRENKIKEKK